MNNIISKVAASVLLAGIAISGVNAKSQLVTDGNDTAEWYKDHQDKEFAIDIKGVSEDANLTFIPNINATPGSGFTLKFENGGYAEQASIFLCTYADGNESNATADNLKAIVGNMFSKGAEGTIKGGVMTAPQFQFKNDANETLIENGSHIFFRSDSECKELPKVVGLGASCLTVTAQIVDGVTTQSTAFPDYNTDKRILGETKKMIKVACSTPVCRIDATEDMKKFTNEVKSSGINGEITKGGVAAGTLKRSEDLGEISACEGCNQVQDCVTYIEIANESDKAVQGIKFALDFYNKKGEKSNDSLKLKSTVIELDGNKTTDYTINGSTVSLTGLTLDSGDGNTTIKVTYTPNETDVIPEGEVQARVFDLDTNTSDNNGADVIYDEVKKFATFEVSGLTTFTVPYMNGNVSDMVKISTHSESEATLSADITDSKGNTCHVDLKPIPAKGSTMVFANTKASRTTAQYQNLIDAGECSELETKEYKVVFTTSGAADVVSYMTMSNGSQRYVDVY